MARKKSTDKPLTISERLWKVLSGEPSNIKTAEGALSTLYRTITAGLNVKPLGYRKGLDALVNVMVKNGDITKEQKVHKHGNLNNGLCADTVSWKFFIDGLRLLILIPGMKILSVRFQVVIEKDAGRGKVETHTFSTTVHEENKK